MSGRRQCNANCVLVDNAVGPDLIDYEIDECSLSSLTISGVNFVLFYQVPREDIRQAWWIFFEMTEN